MDDGVFVHVVTFNSARWIDLCINSVLEQKELSLGSDLFLSIIDNNSSDNSADISKQYSSRTGCVTQQNSVNIGFCGANNQGAKTFLESQCKFFLILNPDIRLDSLAIHTLRNALISDSSAGSATSKLFRADDNLSLSSPKRLDAAGMELTTALRHFDRGSEQADTYNKKEYVFGGTGACVMYTRAAVERLLLEGAKYDSSKCIVHPELLYNPESRVPLFDEVFFAYREDADLAWRAQLLGFRCIYVPESVGFHRRVVLPTNRSNVASELNGYSVRNRFLMQINNYFFSNSLYSLFTGLVLRNFIVIAGVLIKERSSLKYLKQVLMLRKRAYERRAILRAKCGYPPRIV